MFRIKFFIALVLLLTCAGCGISSTNTGFTKLTNESLRRIRTINQRYPKKYSVKALLVTKNVAEITFYGQGNMFVDLFGPQDIMDTQKFRGDFDYQVLRNDSSRTQTLKIIPQ